MQFSWIPTVPISLSKTGQVKNWNPGLSTQTAYILDHWIAPSKTKFKQYDWADTKRTVDETALGKSVFSLIMPFKQNLNS